MKALRLISNGVLLVRSKKQLGEEGKVEVDKPKRAYTTSTKRYEGMNQTTKPSMTSSYQKFFSRKAVLCVFWGSHCLYWLRLKKKDVSAKSETVRFYVLFTSGKIRGTHRLGQKVVKIKVMGPKPKFQDGK